MLAVQLLTRTAHESTSQVSGVNEFDLFEEFSAFMFIVDYIDHDDDVFQKFQIMQWSEDRKKKCVIASDTSERIAAFYEDSVADALVELMTFCVVGLNVDDETVETTL